MIKKFSIKSVIFIAVIGLFSSMAMGQDVSAPERVKLMLRAVMAVQGNPALQGPEFRDRRRAEIREIIAANFNTPHMAQEALGPQWEKLQPAERAEFTGVFEALFQDSYSRLVLDFLGQENIVYGRPEIGENRAEIPTIIKRPNEEIPVDYRLMTADRQWLVVDVKIDGVSIVDKYRRSFARVIARESYKSLLSKMRLQQQAIQKD